jgi:competence protein ComEA
MEPTYVFHECLRRPGLLILIAFLGTISAAAQSELPDGPGKATVEKVCSGCHGFSVITQVRADKAHWEATVDDMASRGAEGTDDELDQVVQYLSAHFGPNAPPAPKVNINKASAADLVSLLALPESDAEAIVRYRAKNGRFANLEALESVPGIDAKRIEKRKDRIEFR